LARQGYPAWTVVLADKQRSGRGRYARQWFSPVGLGLYFSLILKPDIPVKYLNLVNLRTALIIGKQLKDNLSGFANLKIRLKWPNDVLINGKKISGILVESEISNRQLNYLVIGAGINLNHKTEDFPEEIRTIATSYRIETDVFTEPKSFLNGLLVELRQRLDCDLQNEFGNVIGEYEEIMANLNQSVQVRLSDQTISGKIKGLDPLGHLILEQESGIRVITSGELWI
jgi:BirA family biotin operon repressor/biotin-[acetyl-CoA-carboxylase] ligase